MCSTHTNTADTAVSSRSLVLVPYCVRIFVETRVYAQNRQRAFIVHLFRGADKIFLCRFVCCALWLIRPLCGYCVICNKKYKIEHNAIDTFEFVSVCVRYTFSSLEGAASLLSFSHSHSLFVPLSLLLVCCPAAVRLLVDGIYYRILLVWMCVEMSSFAREYATRVSRQRDWAWTFIVQCKCTRRRNKIRISSFSQVLQQHGTNGGNSWHRWVRKMICTCGICAVCILPTVTHFRIFEVGNWNGKKETRNEMRANKCLPRLSWKAIMVFLVCLPVICTRII